MIEIIAYVFLHTHENYFMHTDKFGHLHILFFFLIRRMWDFHHIAILKESEAVLLWKNTIQTQGRDIFPGRVLYLWELKEKRTELLVNRARWNNWSPASGFEFYLYNLNQVVDSLQVLFLNLHIGIIIPTS